MTCRFGDVVPGRTFRNSRSVRHIPGWYSADQTAHSFRVLAGQGPLPIMDFDPPGMRIGRQPFRRHWHPRERRNVMYMTFKESERQSGHRAAPELGEAERPFPPDLRESSATRRPT